MVTVQELKKALRHLPPQMPVVLGDEGGNRYSPAREVDLIHYAPETPYVGQEWFREIQEERGESTTPPADSYEAICLWPIG